MVKTLSKVGLEGTYLYIVKAIYDKPTASIVLNWQKTVSVPLKVGKKTGMSAFTSLIQHSTRSPSHSSPTRINKRHPNWKGSKTVIICR